MSATALAVVEPQEVTRAEACRLHIAQVGSEIHRSFIVLGRLLKEARDNQYHLEWGFPRFGMWVEEYSGLDMSERTAYDFIKAVELAGALGIPDHELEQIKISNLKEICSLPDDTDPERVRELLQEAKSLPHKEMRALVGREKGEEWVYHSVKILREVEDNVYQPALERARREYGNTINPDGDPDDISDSRCLEMILANYLAGLEEQEEYPIIDRQFLDIVASSEEEEPDQATTIGIQGPMPVSVNSRWLEMQS